MVNPKSTGDTRKNWPLATRDVALMLLMLLHEKKRGKRMRMKMTVIGRVVRKKVDRWMKMIRYRS